MSCFLSQRRPVVVLSDQDSVGDFVCTAVTSSTQEIGDRVELAQSDFMEGTLPKKSWVRVSKIYTVNAGVALGRFGQLSEVALDRIRTAVCKSVGCHNGRTEA
jgi:mRNA-degrading endonuclease toxin of MazEF toxin-antitoxin module